MFLLGLTFYHTVWELLIIILICVVIFIVKQIQRIFIYIGNLATVVAIIAGVFFITIRLFLLLIQIVIEKVINGYRLIIVFIIRPCLFFFQGLNIIKGDFHRWLIRLIE